jgi:hypothetical protein
MPTDRLQAVLRLQGGELRRRWLATKIGMRIKKKLENATEAEDVREYWIAERRAKDYRAHRPTVDVIIKELTNGTTEQEIWRQMLEGPSTSMERKIPLTVLAKSHGQAMQPPMLCNGRETANTRTAFLAIKCYLNQSPVDLEGFGWRKEKSMRKGFFTG